MYNIYTLNKFLKDELSARETYRQAVDIGFIEVFVIQVRPVVYT